MRTSIVTSYRGPDSRCYLAITTKRRYVFRHDSRAEPATEPEALRAAPEYAARNGEHQGRLLFDTEFIAGMKPTTDVLLHGSAHSHRGAVPALTAAVRVGPVAKAIQVWGDRQILLASGSAISFSSPEPFTTMPLTWERAFGGHDTYAESKEPVVPDTGLHAVAAGLEPTLGGLSYPRNPHGCGFFIDVDRHRLEGSRVPNLDDARDPVRPDRLLVRDYLDWIDCPVAACFEPIDLFMFPRALFFVPPDFNRPSRPIHEIASGILAPADLARMDAFDSTIHARSFNSAPAGLATHRLYGGERVQLWNVHPERELFEFDLAGERPRFMIEPPGVSVRELEPVLQTVQIQPEAGRVTLTWMGRIEVAAVYPDDMTDTMRHAVLWSR